MFVSDVTGGQRIISCLLFNSISLVDAVLLVKAENASLEYFQSTSYVVNAYTD